MDLVDVSGLWLGKSAAPAPPGPPAPVASEDDAGLLFTAAGERRRRPDEDRPDPWERIRADAKGFQSSEERWVEARRRRAAVERDEIEIMQLMGLTRRRRKQ